MTMEVVTQVPGRRIRVLRPLPVKAQGAFVVYWMTAFRRTHSNFALQYACDVARHLEKPLLILEALRTNYSWACDRFHRFIIQGMRDNADSCVNADVTYYPYVESARGEGSGLIAALAERACTIVTDDYPCFFHPRMLRHVARTIDCRFDLVDSNGLMPLDVGEKTFTVAHSYRRFMQKELLKQLEDWPEAEPLLDASLKRLKPEGDLPAGFERKWPQANLRSLLATQGLKDLPIDHSVEPVEVQGGEVEARRLLRRFTKVRLASYDHDRNEPDELGSSELSPHLHFGHISAHEVFATVMESEGWNPSQVSKPNGKVNGYWGVSETAEAFLDQLCTWREIGFNMCWRESNYAHFSSLPSWAQKTLEEHGADQRPYLYSLEEFENAQTHDPIWNAAQRQLVREGRIHNYLRMLWGKKILHWTESPREALKVMVELNNKYALDGRDPNSYSGIFWVLGRYDRAWGPEREVFGKIRYMTSENTAKKHALKQYLQRYSADT